MSDMETPGTAMPGDPEREINQINNNHRDGASGAQEEPVFGTYDIPNLPPWELTAGEEARRAALFDAAFGYRKQGLRLIPLYWIRQDGACSCGRDCGDSAGKHPIYDKWNEAGADPDADLRWWRAVGPSDDLRDWHPLANIGILAGEVSGVFVVDTDPKYDGHIRWEALVAEHDGIPPSAIAQTGSKGRHFYFRWPGFPVGNYKPWGRDAGVDIKGDGGYLVAPPSVSGKGPYSWVAELPFADAPAWVTDTIREYGKLQRGEPSLLRAPVAPEGAVQAYVKAALAGEAFVLRNAPEGSRNGQLNTSALKLGSIGAWGLLAEDEAFAALWEAALAAGLRSSEIGPTFRSGWTKGLENPRDLSEVGTKTGREFPLREWNGHGLGDRMCDWYAGRLRFCDQEGTWYSYQGTWRRASKSQGEWSAQVMIRALPDTEGHGYSDEKEPDEKESPLAAFLKQQAKWCFSQWAREAERNCRGYPVMQLDRARCDADPYLINLANGTWDGTEGRLLPHNPDHLLTMQSPVAYDPAAACPGWLAFLERVQPDPEMRAYLQRVMGYSITGDTGGQKMFIHHGEGANGKSVFHDVMARVFGDYAQTVPVETLIQTRMTGSVPTDIARMIGKRYLSASEPKEGTRLDEQAIKQLTGGELVSARFMRMDYFEFKPVGKIHLTSNHLQHVSDAKATWRRLQLIGWDVTIPEDEREPNLSERLFHEEASGILGWVLAGLAEWRRHGLNPPSAVTDRTEEYRREEDSVERWLEECIDIRPGADLRPISILLNSDLAILHGSFADWFYRETRKPSGMSSRTLSTKLQGKGYAKVKGPRGMGFPQLSVRMPDPAGVPGRHLPPV